VASSTRTSHDSKRCSRTRRKVGLHSLSIYLSLSLFLSLDVCVRALVRAGGRDRERERERHDRVVYTRETVRGRETDCARRLRGSERERQRPAPARGQSSKRVLLVSFVRLRFDCEPRSSVRPSVRSFVHSFRQRRQSLCRFLRREREQRGQAAVTVATTTTTTVAVVATAFCFGVCERLGARYRYRTYTVGNYRLSPLHVPLLRSARFRADLNGLITRSLCEALLLTDTAARYGNSRCCCSVACCHLVSLSVTRDYEFTSDALRTLLRSVFRETSLIDPS